VANPYAPTEQVRVRWDNLLIVAMAVLACALAVPLLLDVKIPLGGQAKPTQAPSETDESTTTPLTMSEAEALDIVARAQSALDSGDFTQAEQLVAEIPAELAMTVGAVDLDNEIARRATLFATHSTAAQAAADNGDWRAVEPELAQAAKVAPLTADLAALRREAVTRIAELDALDAAAALLESGALADAHEAAQRGYAKYQSEGFAELLAKVEQAQRAADRREARQQAEAASVENVVSTSTTGGGSGGGGSGSTTSKPAGQANTHAGHDQSTAMTGTNLSIDPQLMNQALSALNTELG
jgi:hypothetical protein